MLAPVQALGRLSLNPSSEAPEPPFPIDRLPPNFLTKVFSCLEPVELGSHARVCRAWTLAARGAYHQSEDIRVRLLACPEAGLVFRDFSERMVDYNEHVREFSNDLIQFTLSCLGMSGFDNERTHFINN